MKPSISIIIGALLIVVLSVFTVLYFTNPRVVEIERIIEIIPDDVSVTFPISPPDVVRDTVYVVIKEDSVYREVHGIYSGKTFKQALLSIDGSQEWAQVESEVGVYSTYPVDLIENVITITPYKDIIARDIMKNLPKERSYGFLPGFAVGAGVTIGIGAVVLLVGR